MAKKKTAKKMSCLDAAAKVLKGRKSAMNCRQMIAAMANRGLWESPSGKTPWLTLQAAIIREIVAKKQQSRFRKVAPGLFALK